MCTVSFQSSGWFLPSSLFLYQSAFFWTSQWCPMETFPWFEHFILGLNLYLQQQGWSSGLQGESTDPQWTKCLRGINRFNNCLVLLQSQPEHGTSLVPWQEKHNLKKIHMKLVCIFSVNSVSFSKRTLNQFASLRHLVLWGLPLGSLKNWILTNLLEAHPEHCRGGVGPDVHKATFNL